MYNANSEKNYYDRASYPERERWQEQKHFKLRDDVLKEIRSEAWKISFLTFLITIIFGFFLALTIIWFLNRYQVVDLEIETVFFLFQPWIFMTATIFFFLVACYIYLNHYRFAKEKQYHFAHKEEVDPTRVPNFIIDKYKRLSGLGIFFGWLLFFSSLIGGIFLTFFLLLRDKEYIELLGMRIEKEGGKAFPDYQKEIIFLASYLGTTFLLFLIVTIYVSKEKSRLVALFDLKNKFNNWEEIYRFQKKVHIICFCLFVLPLVILYFLRKMIKKMIKK